MSRCPSHRRQIHGGSDDEVDSRSSVDTSTLTGADVYPSNATGGEQTGCRHAGKKQLKYVCQGAPSVPNTVLTRRELLDRVHALEPGVYRISILNGQLCFAPLVDDSSHFPAPDPVDPMPITSKRQSRLFPLSVDQFPNRRNASNNPLDDVYENINVMENGGQIFEHPSQFVMPKQAPPQTVSATTSHRSSSRRGAKGARERDDVFLPENFYIGVLDRRQARRRCRKRTNFRLFHELSSDGQIDNLEPELKLCVVYRTSRGKYCFFPIVEQASESHPQLGATTCFYVDYGDSDAPKFMTIAALVRYYSVYVHLRRNKKGGIDPDAFPWWVSEQNSDQ